MKLIERKRYLLHNTEQLQFYVRKSCGLIYVTARDLYDKNEFRWIDRDIKDIRLLWRSKDYADPSCYILFENSNGKGCIMELFSKQVILERFVYNSYKGIARSSKTGFDDKEDIYVRFLNKKTKYFALYSLFEKKFVFGPYNYNAIEEYQYGVILDERTAISNSGSIDDLLGYDCDDSESVYYNKETGKYLFLVNTEGLLFIEPTQNGNVFVVELEEFVYRYNPETEDFDIQRKDDDGMSVRDYLHQWDEYADIPFEGHSRLELGLD